MVARYRESIAFRNSLLVRLSHSGFYQRPQAKAAPYDAEEVE
jgi:hypothetical protein